MHTLAIAAAWAAICVLLVTGSRPAAADILVNISKSAQRMSVLVDGTARYHWTVSTGAKHYTTPSGVYKPQWLARKWRSRQYANAPMPHSIFFDRGYAIHGTTEVARLGKTASHGCVRLHPDNAATLYSLVQKQMANTRVVVSDDLIEAPSDAPRKKPSHFVAENVVTEKPAVEAMALPQKIVEPQVTAIARAPAETTAVLQERKDLASDAPRKKPSHFVAENVVTEKPVVEAVAPPQKIVEPQVTATAGAPAETTAVRHERKILARRAHRETQKPLRTARFERPGFHW
jgi:hypothetical protein